MHLDARNAVGRVLFELIVRSAAPFRYFHFCHDYCVHDMSMSSIYVLLRVLPSLQRCNPCIFRMCVVTCANLQSGALAKSVFRDLVISLSPGPVYLMMPYVHVVS